MQYRSVIFYTILQQCAEAEKVIKEINSSNKSGDPIVTDLEPFKKFYGAEDHHQDYYANNSNNQYCQLVINPKLEKIQKEFGDLLNDLYKK